MREEAHRSATLDGWRACSILLVMAGHLLPLGPKSLQLNFTVAATGMVLFFILSGFLIVRGLLHDPSAGPFVVRRLFRIAPAAWLALAIGLPIAAVPLQDWGRYFLFFANVSGPPMALPVEHLWSLCVEVQFYAAIALVAALAGRRGLVLVPLACVAVTTARVAVGAHLSFLTWLRVDEILAGGCLALLLDGGCGGAFRRLLGWLNPIWLLPLLFASAHPDAGVLNYARPYLALLVVGSSLVAGPAWLSKAFARPSVRYIATVSYAVYLAHGVLNHTWLGSGDTVARYLKRPLLFAATFACAHLSTFHFERRFTDYARTLVRRMPRRPVAVAAA